MKKILSLMLIFVICLSLCACGACNCGCCEKAAAEAAVVETVPEETQSQEEKLTELLVAEEWTINFGGTSRYAFLRNGYGLYTNDSNSYSIVEQGFQWVLDGNKLLVMVMDGESNWANLYTFDEDRGAFTQKNYDLSIHNYVETITMFPVSRMAEFE